MTLLGLTTCDCTAYSMNRKNSAYLKVFVTIYAYSACIYYQG